ncbi:hypothetical protein [Streptacidiphilus albus]|jgi:hypothetical protein|nr:hypothetical protein [Streptacidiphilus albus]
MNVRSFGTLVGALLLGVVLLGWASGHTAVRADDDIVPATVSTAGN